MDRFDVFVIGGGGTGSEVAFSVGRRSDLRVGLAERDKLGGECNHYGCVPTKTMLKSAKVAASARDAGRFGIDIPEVSVDFPAVMQRVRSVIEAQSGEGAKPFEEAGIRVFLEEVRLTGEHRIETADGTRIEAGRIVLATGTEADVPEIPGLADGPYWTNKEAIWSPKETPRSLAIIGSGPIGAEFGQIYARFGSRVTIIETLDRVLPAEDADASAAMLPIFEADGITLKVSASCIRAEYGDDGWRLEFEDGDVVNAEQVLVAAGRRTVFDVHDLDAAGIEVDEKGTPVLDDHLRTTAENVWTAGDATGELLFTHVGSYEAELVVDELLGEPRKRDYRVVPRVTFTEPEVASVGLTEEQATSDRHDVATSLVKFSDNERSAIEGQTIGIVKLVADAKSRELLGGHIVGEGAGELIHEVVTAMAGRVDPLTAGEAIHAYPTLSESVKGAFLELAEKLH